MKKRYKEGLSMKVIRLWMSSVIMALFILAPLSVNAGPLYVEGSVSTLEVWANGNVAFMLDTPVSTGCQAAGQFILNQSSSGMKNQLATLLIAKSMDKKVGVYFYTTSSCVAAEGYYGNTYARPDFLYLAN